jgi:hypothetical protein
VKLLGAARASRRVQPKRLGAVGPHGSPCAPTLSAMA